MVALIDKTCRVCLVEQERTVKILDHIQVINECLPITIEKNDGFGDKVCYKCLFEITLCGELISLYKKFESIPEDSKCYLCLKENVNLPIHGSLFRTIRKVESSLTIKKIIHDNKVIGSAPWDEIKKRLRTRKICTECYFMVDTVAKLYEKVKTSDKKIRKIVEETDKWLYGEDPIEAIENALFIEHDSGSEEDNEEDDEDEDSDNTRIKEEPNSEEEEEEDEDCSEMSDGMDDSDNDEEIKDHKLIKLIKEEAELNPVKEEEEDSNNDSDEENDIKVKAEDSDTEDVITKKRGRKNKKMKQEPVHCEDEVDSLNNDSSDFDKSSVDDNIKNSSRKIVNVKQEICSDSDSDGNIIDDNRGNLKNNKNGKRKGGRPGRKSQKNDDSTESGRSSVNDNFKSKTSSLVETVKQEISSDSDSDDSIVNESQKKLKINDIEKSERNRPGRKNTKKYFGKPSSRVTSAVAAVDINNDDSSDSDKSSVNDNFESTKNSSPVTATIKQEICSDSDSDGSIINNQKKLKNNKIEKQKNRQPGRKSQKKELIDIGETSVTSADNFAAVDDFENVKRSKKICSRCHKVSNNLSFNLCLICKNNEKKAMEGIYSGRICKISLIDLKYDKSIMLNFSKLTKNIIQPSVIPTENLSELKTVDDCRKSHLPISEKSQASNLSESKTSSKRESQEITSETADVVDVSNQPQSKKRKRTVSDTSESSHCESIESGKSSDSLRKDELFVHSKKLKIHEDDKLSFIKGWQVKISKVNVSKLLAQIPNFVANGIPMSENHERETDFELEDTSTITDNKIIDSDKKRLVKTRKAGPKSRTFKEYDIDTIHEKICSLDTDTLNKPSTSKICSIRPKPGPKSKKLSMANNISSDVKFSKLSYEESAIEVKSDNKMVEEEDALLNDGADEKEYEEATTESFEPESPKSIHKEQEHDLEDSGDINGKSTVSTFEMEVDNADHMEEIVLTPVNKIDVNCDDIEKVDESKEQNEMEVDNSNLEEGITLKPHSTNLEIDVNHDNTEEVLNEDKENQENGSEENQNVNNEGGLDKSKEPNEMVVDDANHKEDITLKPHSTNLKVDVNHDNNEDKENYDNGSLGNPNVNKEVVFDINDVEVKDEICPNNECDEDFLKLHDKISGESNSSPTIDSSEKI